MIPRSSVAAAAPAWVSQRMAGPLREATIIHSGAMAIYLADESEGEDGRRCLGLLAQKATPVPCGLHTNLISLHEVAAGGRLPQVGETATLGDGRLSVADCDVVVGRLSAHDVPSFDPVNAATMLARMNSACTNELLGDRLPGDRVAHVRAELPAEAMRLLASADPDAAGMLLGRGSGLTPVGDDVLAGWLATMAAARQLPNAVSGAVLQLAPTATTLLSATLLERAIAGEVVPSFRRLLFALKASPQPFPPPTPPSGADSGCSSPKHPESAPLAPESAPLAGLVGEVLGIGHTSGAGLLLGCTLALEHLAIDHLAPDHLVRSCCP